jgi:3-hydroxymyristoyl/3-hydroxydecanoyl-(acyl carrier protein) dehydratase/1-acyl-sn-glycerol-3-phosphate acyltransferase
VHCPEMEEYAIDWLKLHRRPTRAPSEIAFYSNAIAGKYLPTEDLVAKMLLEQARSTVDFPRTIKQAWDDGIRVFIEHGPRSLCSGWIAQSLGARPHLTFSLDRHGHSSLAQALDAVRHMVAAGLRVDLEAFMDCLARAVCNQSARSPGRWLTVPAHPHSFGLPALEGPPAEAPSQYMAPAPPLPPVLEDSDGNGISNADPGEPPLPLEGISARGSPPARLREGRALNHPYGDLIRAIGKAHRQATAAHVQVLQQTIEARFDVLRKLLPLAEHAGSAHGFDVERINAEPLPDRQPAARTFDRQQLEKHASGAISEIFGPLFRQQDGCRRQVRLPEPPLLLPDRVTRLVGEPGAMGTGSVCTETDVRTDSWFVHDGHVPPGVLIEAGQADLFLISWLGVDFLNRDERVYRMLGCELTFFAGSPAVDDTLVYDIHIDEHVSQGNVRLFLFHFDCRVGGQLRLRMRGGQAGFFTDIELREPLGVLWDPSEEHPTGDGAGAPPHVEPRSAFTREQVIAFSEGRAFECFGPGYEMAAAHTLTPHTPGGRLRMIQEIAELDPLGGPWKRGYLRVVNRVSPDDWFFQGHFKNDPCMPGTLMAEAGYQAMAFYLAALGYTLDRDGWRFEPVPGETCRLRCRGQVLPTSRELTLEVFVHEVRGGAQPAIFADILGTVDGVTKAVHGRRLCLQLVPDWPLEGRLDLPAAQRVERRVPASVDGLLFGAASMLACALGRPTKAFGDMYRRFDGPLRTARLPAPPYLFLSRVMSINSPPGAMQAGIEALAEYDLSEDAWYYTDNGAALLPFCALMEVGLQPCGWLASYTGCIAAAEVELFFRNLEGTATVHSSIPPSADTLVTRTRLTDISRSGGIILVSCEVECRINDRLLLDMTTKFGFFPKVALESQPGLPATEEARRRVDEPSAFHLDLISRPTRYFAGSARLPAGKLLMLDRITGYCRTSDVGNVAWLRAEKDVDPAEWFFKAHFFQDPVMPGSLGLEAVVQLLQFFMLHEGLHEDLVSPHFESLAPGRAITWKYRGQVTPTSKRVVVEMRIVNLTRGTEAVAVTADAWLWVDGIRIYHAQGVTARLVAASANLPDVRFFDLDPRRDTWLLDHCPNYILPTLPMMDIVNRLAEAAITGASGRVLIALRQVRLHRWAVLDRPCRFRTTTTEVGSGTVRVRLDILDAVKGMQNEQTFQPLADGVVVFADAYPPPPAPLPALADAIETEDPYASGAVTHGPAFQVVRSLCFGTGGATAVIDAAAGVVPVGVLHTALLDGALHALSNDDPRPWSPHIPADQFALPCGLSFITLHGPTPRTGEVRCEIRFDGFTAGRVWVAFRIQLFTGAGLWADIRSLHMLVPKGPIGIAGGRKRRAFLRDRIPVPSVCLSKPQGAGTYLTFDEVRTADWLPGSVAAFYGAQGDFTTVTAQVAIKEHLARKIQLHPSAVVVAPDLRSASHFAEPLGRWPVQSITDSDGVTVIDDGEPQLDFDRVRKFWQRGSASETVSPFVALVGSMCGHFVRRLVLADPQSLTPLRGRPVLFLANHQVLLESVMFSLVAPVVIGSPIVALAKIEQRDSILIQTMNEVFASFPEAPTDPIAYFDQNETASFLVIMEELKEAARSDGRSILVHVAGGRALSCRAPVATVGAALFDLALDAELPIVPVRFTGGLPVLPVSTKLDIPVDYGSQDYWIGSPILPAQLTDMGLIERKELLLQRINGLGPSNTLEEPARPDQAFGSRVARRMQVARLSQTEAVLLECAGLPLDAQIGDLLS